MNAAVQEVVAKIQDHQTTQPHRPWYKNIGIWFAIASAVLVVVGVIIGLVRKYHPKKGLEQTHKLITEMQATMA